MNIARVNETKAAINALSHDEAFYLWGCFSEKEWVEWDTQLESDFLSGKLNFLIE